MHCAQPTLNRNEMNNEKETDVFQEFLFKQLTIEE